ncbi:hypothetical protein AND_010489 [Anopheles darlingi]|uniref:Uncharacterized protein n=1 Tax=Anopheles darlingi TaxID=43151 RepID=W5J1B9_ANODA|nr:hypothetical protein AND_010489 [Anopheles darlingi]
MGSFNSKVSPSNDKIRNAEQGEEPTTDPRSPTLHINRSPISPEGGVSRASITKVKDLTLMLTETEEPMATSLQTPTLNQLPKRFQSIIDPRSPSTFTRTPLLVDTQSVTLDCSNLTNVVSTLQYDEDHGEASFKDCDTEGLPVNICSLQIEHDDDESAPILEEPTDPNEVTVFEDAEVVPFAGIDPRSPSIAIARTPMVLGKDEGDDRTEMKREAMMEQVAKEEDMKRNVEGQEHTPKQNDLQQQEQPQGDEAGRGEPTTPKKDKQSPSSGGLKAGARTPLGCVTNIGAAGNNIRRLALMGQLKQKSIATDEQKLIARSPNTGSAESVNSAAKHVNRSRIPKLRLS